MRQVQITKTLSEQAHALYVRLETERRRVVSDIIIAGGIPKVPALNHRRERLQYLRDRAYVRFERRANTELIAYRDERAGRFSDMPTDPEDE